MYINRTGINSPIAKIVKLDKDARGVSIPTSSDTAILGVVISVSGGNVEVASDGVRMVFINGVFREGQVVYLKKSGQSGGMGTCYAFASPTAPYVKIGTALESGSSRVAKIMMGIGVVSGSTSGTTTSTVGPPGPQGRQGERGELGLRGADGLPGVAGVDGRDGVAPVKGVDYFDGVKGDTGLPGERGLQGNPGANGTDGADGYTPVKGINYSDGAQGLKGDKGDPGIQGLQGGQGIQGLPGADGQAGIGVPGIKGDDGLRGLPGLPGNDGAPGADGHTPVKGVDYSDGTDGSTGLPGYTPVKGVDYFDGSTGAPGYTPLKNVDYFDGVKGDKGDQGLPGTAATVTKPAVEAVLTGEISTHTHPAAGGADPWVRVKLASDFTTSLATNVNVTGFAFTPAINKTYLIFGYFLLRTATATVGARPGVAWPANLTDSVMRIEAANSLTVSSLQLFGARTTKNAASTGLATTSESHWGSLDGMMITSGTTSGTFQITLASETAATNVIMKAGSVLMYREL